MLVARPPRRHLQQQLPKLEEVQPGDQVGVDRRSDGRAYDDVPQSVKGISWPRLCFESSHKA